jgi:nitroreductase
MQFDRLVNERYSVRKFTEEPVSDEEIQKILDSIYVAPSGQNKQPLRVWTIRSKDRLEGVKRITKYHYNAPLTIAICAVPEEGWVRKSDGSNHSVVDAAAATMQAWLMAEDIGLGAVWVSDFDTNLQDEIFPEMKGTELVAMLQIGHISPESKPLGWHSKKRDRSEMFFEL